MISALNTLLTMNFMARLVKRIKNHAHLHKHIYLQVSHINSTLLFLADGTICCAVDTLHHYRAGQFRRVVRHVY